ncbi:AfsR/SARP family transcriptional regulator [Streptomyces inhibens]|uniref:AfsR/SARP family transcriptional regulator n=1 Tax=Streptomyces inhibens TaxID=2293571 RepID=UPI0015F24C21|nr:tetratricopeptide repeat protein [Streptomyces inhibens]
MEFRLMGTVELRSGARGSGLGSGKERIVLAALAHDVGRPVSIETLAHRLWDDSPPRRARPNLYTYVSRVRRALAEIGGAEAPPLALRARTYTLEADPETVDLRRYLNLVARARVLSDSGDTPGALGLLDRAAALYRGEPLAGLSGSWAEQVRTTVAARQLAATLTRSGIELRLGHFAEVVPDLTTLLERHPADEALTAQLALALYGCGRIAEATEVLHKTGARLRRGFGADPGSALRRIQRGILSGVPAAELLTPAPAAPVTSGPAPTTGLPVPDNLPRDVPWVGRRDELRRLTAALTDAPDSAASARHPVVALEAIDGMGGVGKTSLAVHAAHLLRHRFPGGRVHLDLRAHAPFEAPLEPAAALGILLRRFGMPAARIPHELEELVAQWRALLSDRRAVIILDDATGPDQVRPLLPAGSSPSLVIITSRSRLTGLPDVRPISLGALTPDDAVALLRSRLGNERLVNDESAAEIVRFCGHLPLALDMVTSRLKTRTTWSTADLRDRLVRERGRLGEIRDASGDITRTFDFSYRGLTAPQQHAFRMLGRHIGSEFGVHAAAALIDRPVDGTERTLEELLNLHMVMEPSPHRFRLHDLLRVYANELTADVPDADHDRQAVQRLTDFYLHTADRADRMLYPHRARIGLPVAARPAELPQWLDPAGPKEWLLTEKPNLLAVVEYARAQGDTLRTALLAHVLGEYLVAEGHWDLARELHEAAVAHWRAEEDAGAEARALLDLTTVLARGGGYDRALRAAHRALDLARRAPDPEAEAEALHQQAVLLWYTARNLEALPLQQQALSLRMRTADRRQQARSLLTLGIILLHLGSHAEAFGSFQDALERFRAVDDRRGQYLTLNNLGELHLASGAPDRAGHAYRQALTLARSMSDRAEQATVRMNLAGVLTTAGELDEALTLHSEALEALRDIGDRRNEAVAMNALGRTLQLAGRDDEALAHHRAAVALARRIGAACEEARALRELGLAELRTGRVGQAARHLEGSLALARRIQAPDDVTRSLEALAKLREAEGNDQEAIALRQEAAVLQRSLESQLAIQQTEEEDSDPASIKPAPFHKGA